MTVQLRSGGNSFRLRVADGWIDAERGEVANPDLTVAGEPRAAVAAIVLGHVDPDQVTIEGDLERLAELREMVVLPERLQSEALEESAATAGSA